MPARLPLAFLRTLAAAVVLIAGAPGASIAATLSGLVSDPDGRPMPDVRVIVHAVDIPVATATTDAKGRYAIESLPAGRYIVLALRDGFRSAPATVDLGAADTRDLPIALALSPVSETLVVSAAHVDVPVFRAGDSVTIIPSSTLDARQIESAVDALRFVPGLAVARSGGRGALTSVFSRGGESDYTLVLIDGLETNTFGGGFDFSQLAVADVEQIEVVRGPQSALFGSDAIGGVVQLVTRHGGPPRTRGFYEQGSLKTLRTGASTSGSTGAFTWHASGEGWRSDGFTGAAPASGETVTNDDGRLTEGGFGAGWSDARAGELRFDGRIGSSDRGFPGPFGSDPLGTFSGVDTISRGHRERKQFGVRYAGRLGGSTRVRQRASASHTALDGRFVSVFDPDHPSTDATRRFDLRLQTDVALNATTAITAGLEHTRENGESSFVADEAGGPVPIERRITGYFVEARINPVAGLYANAGIRIEDIHRNPVTAASTGVAFDEESIVSANPKLTLTYYVRPERKATNPIGWTRLRLTAGTGIRPPDVFEIAFTDNPGLAPERTRSFDAGVGQALAGGALLVDATVFFNRYDDLIVAVGRAQNDVSRFRTDNISNARARGIEITASARTGGGLDLQAGYTWLSTSVLAFDGASGEAPDPFAVGDPLIRRPRHQASFAATYVRDRVTAYVDVNGRGRTLDVEPAFGLFGGVFPNPGYFVTNTGASVKLAKSIDVYGRVQNLFDRGYEEALGFPALGRTGMVGVRVAVRH